MGNPYYFSGAVLLALIGVIHTVLGEILIFRRMRTGGWVPTHGAPVLHERHVRILWATWHLVTVLGFLVALLLLQLGHSPVAAPEKRVLALATAVAMLASSTLVLVGTRGRHPGWAGLLIVAALIGAGTAA